METKKDLTKNWAEKVSKLPVRRMTQEEVEFYMRVFFNETEINNDDVIIDALEKKKAGMASVLWLRIKHLHTYKITPSLALFLGNSIIKNFGTSTMIANYLQYIAYEHNLDIISVKEWNQIVFPNGYPTDESWNKAWDLQKITPEIRKEYGITDFTDNILDYPQFSESIRTNNSVM